MYYDSRRRAYRLADGSIVTVQRTRYGVIIRDRNGDVITATTNSL